MRHNNINNLVKIADGFIFISPEAAGLLTSSGQEGCFLVRESESSSGEYALFLRLLYIYIYNTEIFCFCSAIL